MKRFAPILLLVASAPVAGKEAESEEVRKVMQSLGACVARVNIIEAEVFLAQPDDQVMSKKLRRSLPDCLGNAGGEMLKGKQQAFRFALAEAVLVRRYKESGPPLLAAAAHAPPRPATTISAELPGETEVGSLGQCIVRTAPKESWALLRTKAASRQEKEAFVALGPTMKSCVRSGLTVRMNKFFMRGAIAENYYRLSRTQPTEGRTQ